MIKPSQQAMKHVPGKGKKKKKSGIELFVN